MTRDTITTGSRWTCTNYNHINGPRTYSVVVTSVDGAPSGRVTYTYDHGVKGVCSVTDFIATWVRTP